MALKSNDFMQFPLSTNNCTDDQSPAGFWSLCRSELKRQRAVHDQRKLNLRGCRFKVAAFCRVHQQRGGVLPVPA
jgi:hypothetical protein